jgi:ribosomal protein S18 acetylase RimI-like enzyme
MNYVVDCYYSIEDIPSIFDDLLQYNDQKSIFLSRQWFLLLEQTIYHNKVVIFTIKSTTGEPLLLLPCYQQFDKGKHLYSLANYYSPYYTLLLAQSLPLSNTKLSKIFSALLLEINRYHYDSIHLQPLDKSSFEYSVLVGNFKKNGYFVDTFFCFGNWYEVLTSFNFVDYYDKRPSKLKNTLRRKEKKLKNYQIKIESDYYVIQQLLPEYQSIYEASWKVTETYPLFIEKMVLSFAKERKLRLGIAYIDGQPAAAQIWLVHDDINSSQNQIVLSEKVASIYKLAYDPQFKSTSIGSILTAALFEYVIEIDQVNKIDYLTGDDGYKKDWVSQRQERWGMVAYNKSTMWGMLRGLKFVIFQYLKKLR